MIRVEAGYCPPVNTKKAGGSPPLNDPGPQMASLRGVSEGIQI